MNSQSYDFNSYLTIEALEDEFSVSFTNDLQYSINGGRWNILQGGESTPYVNVGDRISFKGKLIPIEGLGIGTFQIDKSCNLLGNCMPILYGEDLMYGSFNSLFKDCIGIKGVSKDFLPATTLAEDCYREMFEGCTNLNYIKMLATNISADGCLSNWVYGVSPTGTFVKSKDATWDIVGDSGVPTGWTVITDDQEDDEVNLISFTISEGFIHPDVVEYTAIEGMTWREWVYSEYNTGGYYIEDSLVLEKGGLSVAHGGTGVVCRADEAIESKKYTWT